MSESPLMIKSKAFALEVIRACKVLREARCESALINQFLRSGTSIGANVFLLKASAEKTDIPTLSCDAVVIGTAFHWFDKEKFYTECRRILKNNKYVAILRIANNTEADKQINKIKHYSEQDLNEAKAFFGDGFLEHICFEYSQFFDEERYIKNLLSSATAPLPNDARFYEYI